MSDILLESPPANGATSTEYSPEQAQSVFAPDKATTSSDNGGRTQTLANEPDKAATPPAKTEPAKAKGPLDKVGKISKPEPAKVEQTADKTVQPVNDKEKNWNLLRERAEKAEKELGTIKPEYEKIKPAYETTKQEYEALKAQGLNDQERKEYASLREQHAVEMVKASREFKEKIEAPIQKRVAKIQSVATNARLSPQATSALLDAVDIADEFQRAKAIRAIVKGEELEPEDYQALADSAVSTANDLNENWYPKMDETLAKANEVQTAARAKTVQQQQELTTKQQGDFKKAHEDVYQQLSTESLKPLFDEADLSVEGTTLADAMKNPAKASSPQEMAAQEQLAAAAPFMIEHINRLLKKVFDLEQANKLRNGSAPNRGDGATKGQEMKDKPLDPKEVFQGRGKNYMGG